MSETRFAEAPFVLALVLALACDTAARRPPGPGESALPAASASAPERPDAREEGFAAELLPEATEPPARPSGQSSVGRFSLVGDPHADAVFERLRAAIARRSGKLHAVLFDLELGQALVFHRGKEKVNPASNMKLLTAAAALDLLGPAYTFRTELWADIDVHGRTQQLVLRGGGDPALSSADLFRLAESAARQGLRKVGQLQVDQSLFDTPFVPPAFASQPREWAAFRAPISAAAVDGNSVTLNVVPTQVGEPARIWYEPPGVVDSVGSVETRASGSGDRVTWTLEPNPDPTKPRSLLGGGLAAGFGRQRFTRRLEDPRRAPGLVLAHFLSLHGIEIEGDVTLSATGPATVPARLSYVASAPLSELLRPLGKDSDNFTAEMMLVALSDAASGQGTAAPSGSTVRRWSTAQGAAALTSWLEAGGISTQDIEITNGSGLFDANQLTVETLALVLSRMEDRPEVFAEYLAQLSVYGTDGTLRGRMKDSPARSRVRAKTGTLSGVDSLSGYVLRSAGLRPLVFSLVVTGASGGHAAVRRALDQAVFEWATQLENPAPKARQQ